MNKLIALSIGMFFLALIIPLHAQEVEDRDPLDIEFRAGTQLLYIVEAGGTKYNFDVTLTRVGESIAFDYTMSAPANLAGSVTISSEALENAERMVNYFNGGELNLRDATTVFLSRKVFASSNSIDDVKIYLDDNTSPAYLGTVVSPVKHKLIIDGQEESLETTFIARQ